MNSTTSTGSNNSITTKKSIIERLVWYRINNNSLSSSTNHHDQNNKSSSLSSKQQQHDQDQIKVQWVPAIYYESYNDMIQYCFPSGNIQQYITQQQLQQTNSNTALLLVRQITMSFLQEQITNQSIPVLRIITHNNNNNNNNHDLHLINVDNNSSNVDDSIIKFDFFQHLIHMNHCHTTTTSNNNTKSVLYSQSDLQSIYQLLQQEENEIITVSSSSATSSSSSTTRSNNNTVQQGPQPPSAKDVTTTTTTLKANTVDVIIPSQVSDSMEHVTKSRRNEHQNNIPISSQHHDNDNDDIGLVVKMDDDDDNEDFVVPDEEDDTSDIPLQIGEYDTLSSIKQQLLQIGGWTYRCMNTYQNSSTSSNSNNNNHNNIVYYWIKPNCSVDTGRPNIDYYTSDDELQLYIQSLYPYWKGYDSKKQSRTLNDNTKNKKKHHAVTNYNDDDDDDINDGKSILSISTEGRNNQTHHHHHHQQRRVSVSIKKPSQNNHKSSSSSSSSSKKKKQNLPPHSFMSQSQTYDSEINDDDDDYDDEKQDEEEEEEEENRNDYNQDDAYSNHDEDDEEVDDDDDVNHDHSEEDEDDSVDDRYTEIRSKNNGHNQKRKSQPSTKHSQDDTVHYNKKTKIVTGGSKHGFVKKVQDVVKSIIPKKKSSMEMITPKSNKKISMKQKKLQTLHWWKYENIPSMKLIRPILQKIGFKYNTNIQKYQLPPICKNAIYMSTIGLRKFLCCYGIPNYNKTNGTLSLQQQELLRRWIVFANVPIKSNSKKRESTKNELRHIESPKKREQLITKLYTLGFSTVDGKIFVPEYKQMIDYQMNPKPIHEKHYYYIDTELYTKVRWYIRHNWRLGVITDIEQYYDYDIKRLDSMKYYDTLLYIRLWAATSSQPIPKFTSLPDDMYLQPYIQMIDEIDTPMNDEDSSSKEEEEDKEDESEEETMSDASTPYSKDVVEKNVVPNDMTSPETSITSIDSASTDNSFEYGYDNPKWYLYQPIPDFGKSIWPILQKLRFNFKSGSYGHPDVIEPIGNSIDIQHFCVKYGLPNYFTDCIDDNERLLIHRWASFAHVDVRPSNSIAKLNTVKNLTTTQIHKLLIALKFQMTDNKIYVPGADHMVGGRSDRQHGIHYFIGLEEIRVYIRSTNDLLCNETSTQRRRTTPPSISSDDMLALRLWAALSDEPLPKFQNQKVQEDSTTSYNKNRYTKKREPKDITITMRANTENISNGTTQFDVNEINESMVEDDVYNMEVDKTQNTGVSKDTNHSDDDRLHYFTPNQDVKCSPTKLFTASSDTSNDDRVVQGNGSLGSSEHVPIVIDVDVYESTSKTILHDDNRVPLKPSMNDLSYDKSDANDVVATLHDNAIRPSIKITKQTSFESVLEKACYQYGDDDDDVDINENTNEHCVVNCYTSNDNFLLTQDVEPMDDRDDNINGTMNEDVEIVERKEIRPSLVTFKNNDVTATLHPFKTGDDTMQYEESDYEDGEIIEDLQGTGQGVPHGNTINHLNLFTQYDPDDHDE